jgi:hypothetical protein
MSKAQHWSLNRAIISGHRNSIDGVWTMNNLKKLEEEVSAWSSISVHPHRFGGREFLFGKAEVGHVHIGGIVDIPFTRPIRDGLLAEGLAEQHRWVPNSGWITFRVRSEQDVAHVRWLMRLSSKRGLKRSSSTLLLEQLSWVGCELECVSQIKSLLEQFVPAIEKAVALIELSEVGIPLTQVSPISSMPGCRRKSIREM